MTKTTQPPLVRQTSDTIEKLVREEWGKLLASLIAQLRDFQLAEDALQDALESALKHWQRNGLPRSPAAWLLQTARRKAIDRLRRNANFKSKVDQIAYETKLNALVQMDTKDMAMANAPDIPDERLALIFTCCHPALDKKSRTALTLHTLGGLTTSEIAHAFLDKQTTMAQRLVRAKRKIASAGIPYAVPNAEQWPARIQTVLSVLYFIFNEGYFSAHGENQVRINLTKEAIRLTQILANLMPSEAETAGLLALMLLHDSRRAARQDKAGYMVALAHQDRSLWDEDKMSQGLKLLNQTLSKRRPGPYQIQAAISAIHAEAESFETTNWLEIAHLYDQLYLFQPNPVVTLNKIVAISHLDGPDIALQMLSKIETDLANYQPFYAAKGDFLRLTGNLPAAETAFLKAIDLTSEEKTRVFLQQKLGAMLRAN